MPYRTDSEHIANAVNGRAVVAILSGLGLGAVFWSVLFFYVAS